MKKTPTKTGMTTYLLIMKDGTKQKITCPTKWSLTFGPLCPGSKDNNGFGATSLRIRDGVRQKAVFTNVESFRDMSMGIESEIVKTQEETFYRDDENGEKKAVRVQGSVTEWVNPDEPKPTKPEATSSMPKLLSASKDIFSLKS